MRKTTAIIAVLIALAFAVPVCLEPAAAESEAEYRNATFNVADATSNDDLVALLFGGTDSGGNTNDGLISTEICTLPMGIVMGNEFEFVPDSMTISGNTLQLSAMDSNDASNSRSMLLNATEISLTFNVTAKNSAEKAKILGNLDTGESDVNFSNLVSSIFYMDNKDALNAAPMSTAKDQEYKVEMTWNLALLLDYSSKYNQNSGDNAGTAQCADYNYSLDLNLIGGMDFKVTDVNDETNFIDYKLGLEFGLGLAMGFEGTQLNGDGTVTGNEKVTIEKLNAEINYECSVGDIYSEKTKMKPAMMLSMVNGMEISTGSKSVDVNANVGGTEIDKMVDFDNFEDSNIPPSLSGFVTITDDKATYEQNNASIQEVFENAAKAKLPGDNVQQYIGGVGLAGVALVAIGILFNFRKY